MPLAGWKQKLMDFWKSFNRPWVNFYVFLWSNKDLKIEEKLCNNVFNKEVIPSWNFSEKLYLRASQDIWHTSYMMSTVFSNIQVYTNTFQTIPSKAKATKTLITSYWVFPWIWGWGEGVSSFNLLPCIKNQLMWQTMDGCTTNLAYLTDLSYVALLCWFLLSFSIALFGLVLCGMLQFGLVCEQCTSCAAHQWPLKHNLFPPPCTHTQVTLVFETLMSAGHNFIFWSFMFPVFAIRCRFNY